MPAPAPELTPIQKSNEAIARIREQIKADVAFVSEVTTWLDGLASCFPAVEGAAGMERISRGVHDALELLDQSGLRRVDRDTGTVWMANPRNTRITDTGEPWFDTGSRVDDDEPEKDPDDA